CADFSNSCTDPAAQSHFCDLLRGRDCLCSDGSVVRIIEGHQGTGGGECRFRPAARDKVFAELKLIDHDIVRQVSKPLMTFAALTLSAQSKPSEPIPIPLEEQAKEKVDQKIVPPWRCDLEG